MSEEGIFSRGKKLILEEEQLQLKKEQDELLEVKRKLDQTRLQLEQLEKVRDVTPVKLGDFSLIDSNFTKNLLLTVKNLSAGYIDTLAKTQKKIDELDKRNQETVSALQKTVDDTTVLFERIMAALQEIAYVLSRNADLERTVLEKLSLELSG